MQVYRNRTVTANGKVVVDDNMDFDSFTKKYFRNSPREDLPATAEPGKPIALGDSLAAKARRLKKRREAEQ